mmetsp:Transcript_36490/g.67974  ORF Transcript_36490/g.67974 Transcript_36490/m.67974 type:complete len:210 (-) Transcript_36490:138-767(-)
MGSDVKYLSLEVEGGHLVEELQVEVALAVLASIALHECLEDLFYQAGAKHGVFSCAQRAKEGRDGNHEVVVVDLALGGVPQFLEIDVAHVVARAVGHFAEHLHRDGFQKAVSCLLCPTHCMEQLECLAQHHADECVEFVQTVLVELVPLQKHNAEEAAEVFAVAEGRLLEHLHHASNRVAKLLLNWGLVGEPEAVEQGLPQLEHLHVVE